MSWLSVPEVWRSSPAALSLALWQLAAVHDVKIVASSDAMSGVHASPLCWFGLVFPTFPVQP
jgi:hypothetical protein